MNGSTALVPLPVVELTQLFLGCAVGAVTSGIGAWCHRRDGYPGLAAAQAAGGLLCLAALAHMVWRLLRW